MTTAQKVTFGVVASALAGVAIGYLIATRGDRAPADPSPTTTVAATAASRQPLYWYDPMYPQQHFDKPGKSPFMDMQLVPKYAESANAATSGTTIDPRVAQNLAIRYATVEKTQLNTTVDAPATVVFNERDVAIVQARAAGYVERVYAHAPGDVIASGAPLADILVPEWSALQIEFQAMKATGDVGLIAAVRQRMQLAGMPEALIADIEHGRARAVVTMRSPVAGVIQELGVRAGMNVQAGATLARINGLSPVWVEAAVSAMQAGAVKLGQVANVVFEGQSAATRSGKVTAILPEINRESRTLRVRVELPNPGGALRPGMFGSLQLKIGQSDALTVPAEAVIRGAAGARVILADAQGRLRPVAVALGGENSGRVVILSGLKEGDRVVASGQFLIDSEANLAGALARLNAASTAQANATGGAALHKARGQVASIGNGQITLAHGPVPSLNWPSMTMTFGLSSPALATRAATGDTVDFTFVERNGQYIVQGLDKVHP